MVEAAIGIFALLAGLGVGRFFWGGKEAALREETGRRAAAEAGAARVPDLEKRLAEREAALSESRASIVGLETRLSEALKNADEKLAILDEARKKLTDAFNALSSEALKSNNTSFLELAHATLAKFQEGAQSDLTARQKAVDELVKPLRVSLDKVDGKLGELEKSRAGAYSALTEQIRGLVDTHLPRLQLETANLSRALRQPIVRGRWGEMQLKRVVEMAQMIEHCDFLTQVSVDDGRLRPDMVVRLPGGKQVVVDAKTPLAAYLDAIEATDEAVQLAKLKNHANQVRDHIEALGKRSYWEQFESSPEFVVMFLPGEMYFSAALQQDPSLIEYGVNEKVIPATPTTLIALLRAVAYGWRQEALAKNAQEVAELGKQLYERVASLAGHWSGVGQRLDQAVKAYNDSVGTLEARVLVSARRLRDLKAGAEDIEIETPAPVELSTRKLQAVPTLPKPGE